MKYYERRGEAEILTLEMSDYPTTHIWYLKDRVEWIMKCQEIDSYGCKKTSSVVVTSLHNSQNPVE